MLLDLEEKLRFALEPGFVHSHTIGRVCKITRVTALMAVRECCARPLFSVAYACFILKHDLPT